jgi:hypothetical protein
MSDYINVTIDPANAKKMIRGQAQNDFRFCSHRKRAKDKQQILCSSSPYNLGTIAACGEFQL